MTTTNKRSWIRWLLGTALFLGLIYANYTRFAFPLPDANPMDFTTYWVAGHTWLHGESAYDVLSTMALLEDDPALAHLVQADGNRFVHFAYPPFTLPLFAGLALFELGDALRVYTALALMGLLSSCVAWLLVLGRRIEVEDVVLLLCIVGLGLGNAANQDIGVGNITWWEVSFCGSPSRAGCCVATCCSLR